MTQLRKAFYIQYKFTNLKIKNMIKINYVKIMNTCSSKDIEQKKKTSHKLRENICNTYSFLDKQLESKIHKEPLQINNKNKQLESQKLI